MRKDNHIHVAFVGNPNCGKTTLFNAVTGSKLKVANWPGVTVEKYEGNITYEGYELKLVDTPGIYSLTCYTIEEMVTRKCVLDDDIEAIAGHGDRPAPSAGDAGRHPCGSGFRGKEDRS